MIKELEGDMFMSYKKRNARINPPKWLEHVGVRSALRRSFSAHDVLLQAGSRGEDKTKYAVISMTSCMNEKDVPISLTNIFDLLSTAAISAVYAYGRHDESYDTEKVANAEGILFFLSDAEGSYIIHLDFCEVTIAIRVTEEQLRNPKGHCDNIGRSIFNWVYYHANDACIAVGTYSEAGIEFAYELCKNLVGGEITGVLLEGNLLEMLLSQLWEFYGWSVKDNSTGMLAVMCSLDLKKVDSGEKPTFEYYDCIGVCPKYNQYKEKPKALSGYRVPYIGEGVPCIEEEYSRVFFMRYE